MWKTVFMFQYCTPIIDMVLIHQFVNLSKHYFIAVTSCLIYRATASTIIGIFKIDVSEWLLNISWLSNYLNNLSIETRIDSTFFNVIRFLECKLQYLTNYKWYLKWNFKTKNQLYLHNLSKMCNLKSDLLLSCIWHTTQVRVIAV